MSVVTFAIIVSIQTITATFEGNLEDQAELMNKMAPNVDAVVIITNQIGSMSDVSRMRIYVYFSMSVVNKLSDRLLSKSHCRILCNRIY